MEKMRSSLEFTKEQLFTFIDKAGKATYAGEGKEVEQPERLGFTEFEFSEGDFSYRDSYTGRYRSRGMEVVRYKGKTVWASMYGGGFIEGKEYLDNEDYGFFKFFKKALSADEELFYSFRGPHEFRDGEWIYNYKQDGDVFELSGYEEIYYKGELVFFHRIIGGIIYH